jgi:hypothetical protein
LPSGNELPRLAEARLAELSRDGSRILCTGKTAKIWDAESGRLLHEIKSAEGAVRHQVRKDRLAQEYVTYLQTGEKYIHYFSLCLDDPKLNGFEVLPSDKEACNWPGHPEACAFLGSDCYTVSRETANDSLIHETERRMIFRFFSHISTVLPEQPISAASDRILCAPHSCMDFCESLLVSTKL